MSMKKTTRRNVKATIFYYLVCMVACLGFGWWMTGEIKSLILGTICGLLGFVVAMIVYREGKSPEEYVSWVVGVAIGFAIMLIIGLFVDAMILIIVLAADVSFMGTIKIRRDIEKNKQYS